MIFSGKSFLYVAIASALLLGIFMTAQSTAQTAPRHHVPFVYYLQNIDVNALKTLNPALAVVDPYDSRLTQRDVRDLRQNHGQQLFAYISAGEVDPNRTQEWDGYKFNPEWEKQEWYNALPHDVQSNDRWSSQRIAYWYPEWHRIMISRALEMQRLGYNGVMLDTVDSFNVLMKPYQHKRDPMQDMAELIGAMRDAVKAVDPHFKIMINSGMALYGTRYSKTGEPFLSLIDGQLKEDTWHNEQGSAAADWTPYDLQFLQQAIDAGVMVLSIDYFTDGQVLTPDRARVKHYFDKAIHFGVVPYAADRDLGKFLDENRQYFSVDRNWQSFAKHGIKP